MPFSLHEAPRTVLRYIDEETDNRKFCGYLSLLCFIPTCGFSYMRIDDNPNKGYDCCNPRPIGNPAKHHLNMLIGSLNKIMKMADERLAAIEPGNKDIKNIDSINPLDLQHAIEWEVNQTLALVIKAINDNVIIGSYKDAIQRAFSDINNNAESSKSYPALINDIDDKMKKHSAKKENQRASLFYELKQSNVYIPGFDDVKLCLPPTPQTSPAPSAPNLNT